MTRPLTFAALALLLAACDSGSSDAGRVAGRYSGARGVPPQAATYTVDLEEADGGAVAGSGTQASEARTVPITVSGMRVAARLRLAFRPSASPAALPDSFVATASADGATLAGTIFRTGVINSSGPLTLTRTPAAP